jgi:hypothetical protein
MSMRWKILVSVGALALIPVAGVAQSSGRAVSVLAGPSQYDLAGTGTTAFVALRIDLPVDRRLVVEPAVTYLAYESQGGARTHHVLPEAQLQVTGAGEVVRPYLGAGLGASWVSRGADDELGLSLSAAGGVRVRTSSSWILRGELRVRAIDPWVGTTADWAVGIGRRF